MKDSANYLDSHLWHACAGGMVQMPPVNTKVFYFPQGHAEHAHGNVDFGIAPKFPSQILCRVLAINFLADPGTDEVFAKIHLAPVKLNDFGDLNLVNDGVDIREEVQEKLASFAKTLTQSDANNGGGFSVPRYCAETIFPRLDHSVDPPVQTVLARDVHGEQWKFRHIYRGTPRRHLLTTGWSTFVNQKKLMAGDSIVFLRAENGELRVGIRRAKRGIAGECCEPPSGWNTSTMANCRPTPYGNLSGFLTEEDNFSKVLGSNVNNTGRGKERITADTVIEAANLATNGQPFEVAYYPRASTPEFCVKASTVRKSTRIQWTAGMRFKMPFETEDSSRISWFMGTISGVQFSDPIRWPQSPWRVLQVTWDEPDLLQNVKRVSPWLVELVSTLPPIHISPFSPPRKKLRHHPNFDAHHPTPTFVGKLVGPPPVNNNTSLYCLSNRTPAGIQGARHGHFGSSFSDLHFNKLQSSPMGIIPSTGFHHYIERSGPMNRNHDYFSNSFTNTATECGSNTKIQPASFLLFGKTIRTTEISSETPSPVGMGNSWTDDSFPNQSWMKERHQAVEMNSPEMGHCKVFMESEDVGRTLDLSVLDSYEELCLKLTDMFGLPESNRKTHVCYRNSTGAVKYAGDEPFG